MCVWGGGGGGGGWEQFHFTWDSNWLATSLLTPAVVEALSPVESVNDGKQAAWFMHKYLQVGWGAGSGGMGIGDE